MAENITVTAAEAMLRLHTPKHGRALVIGSKVYPTSTDRRKLYSDAIGLDMQAGEGVDIVHDLENHLPEAVGKFSHIDCCSVLEHVRQPWKMSAVIEDSLIEGGTLLISVPFVWRQHGYPSDYWRFTPEALDILFPNIKWLDKRLYSNGLFVPKTPSRHDEDNNRWMGRTEAVAFGVKAK